jgi:hypothetical protein
LKEENLKGDEAGKLFNLMEEASINMTPILKIFSKGVFGKYPM